MKVVFSHLGVALVILVLGVIYLVLGQVFFVFKLTELATGQEQVLIDSLAGTPWWFVMFASIIGVVAMPLAALTLRRTRLLRWRYSTLALTLLVIGGWALISQLNTWSVLLSELLPASIVLWLTLRWVDRTNQQREHLPTG